jgi:hypothetical protein
MASLKDFQGTHNDAHYLSLPSHVCFIHLMLMVVWVFFIISMSVRVAMGVMCHATACMARRRCMEIEIAAGSLETQVMVCIMGGARFISVVPRNV